MTARQKTIVLELMTYVMDLTMLLRMIFSQTRTAQGMVPLSETLINQVLEAYLNGPKSSVRTAINNYVDKLDDSREFSSEDAAREIRELIQGNRFDFQVHITTSQTEMPPESTPPTLTSTETTAPFDSFTRTAADDRMISHKILRSYILIFSLKRTNASVRSRSRLSRPELCHGSPKALQRVLPSKSFKLTKNLSK
jgi:hypothetical protein